MTTLNYGVCPKEVLLHGGYGDFVQHTGPMVSGQLSVSLSDAQTLPVTSGYSQDQAANMQSAKNSLKMFQRTKLSFAQILCNSLRVAQASCNSLMGVDYNESLEMARHGGSPSSEAPRKFVATCTPGMRKISHTLNQQIAGEEKGRTANPTLWDACFFNHQENQYIAEPQDNHTEISGEVKPWRRGVLQKFRKTSTGATYKTFVGDRVTGSKPVQPSGASLDFLRCSALSLRPQASSTQAEKLAPGYSALSCSTLASISSISSCGNLIFFCADLALMDFVAIAYPFVDGAGTPYIKGMDKKRLTCGPTDNMVGVHLDYIKMENNNAPECGNTAEASNHNVNEAYTMACQHSTQTRPKFVYLFLASYPSGGKPIMLRTEARLRIAGDYSLTFAAQIRTESPCVIHRYCEEADLTSTYICNKADAHPVCNAGKNSFCVNPCQPRPEAYHV